VPMRSLGLAVILILSLTLALLAAETFSGSCQAI